MVQGLAQCTDIASQAGLARELLYALGITEAENIPPFEEGESLPDYIQRIDPQDLAQIEALGIGGGRRMEEALRAAARLILYQQYSSGRWRYYAASLDTDQWSPYVTHVLDDCLNMSDGEGRRWATAIEVISTLYTPLTKDHLGLVFRGDDLLNAETGELVKSEQGLAANPVDALLHDFSRFAREAGVKLRDLLRQLNNLPRVYWDRLVEYQQGGYLDSEDLAANELDWDRQTYVDNRHLYETILEIRRILELAASPHLSNKQVNRQATGGKPTLPSLVLPEDFDPQWAAFLESGYPEIVSRTGSLSLGQRMVQVRRTVWPICKTCVGIEDYASIMGITPAGYICSDCGGTSPVFTVQGKMRTVMVWEQRVADEYGHYPQEWTRTEEEPVWERGVSEQMDLFGLAISMWEIAVDLEELDDAS